MGVGFRILAPAGQHVCIVGQPVVESEPLPAGHLQSVGHTLRSKGLAPLFCIRLPVPIGEQEHGLRDGRLTVASAALKQGTLGE